MEPKLSTATLLISCPDQPGLVAAVSQLLLQHQANILHADQHIDGENQLFLMRVEWDLRDFNLSQVDFLEIFRPLANRYQMKWKIAYSKDKTRTALFVSKTDHCLVDILHRYRNQELRCEIPLIISNHPDVEGIADFYQIPFFVFSNQALGKLEREQAQLKLLKDFQIQLIVLARYMQILSPEFVDQYPNQIINIHHSFLPAFIGAKPYHQAFERGVKLIGATSHFVTQNLDEGPIIAQGVTQISHRDSVEDLLRKGRDLEKIILSHTLRLYLENRILSSGKKTVIFD